MSLSPTFQCDMLCSSGWPPSHSPTVSQVLSDEMSNFYLVGLLKKMFWVFLFCLKAIEVLGSDQCEFHVTGFTVLGIIVVFPLAGAGA